MTIVEVAKDNNLAGPWFKGESWAAWFAFLATVFGLPLSEPQKAVYARHTGRQALPAGVSREAWVVVGRRGGKSVIEALVAVYLACFQDYSSCLAPGEAATVMVIAAAICDEIAFWRSEESASPDTKMLNGSRPGMATIPGSLLLCISSPYARRGTLWEAYRNHYGTESHVLIWHAATREMNPQVPEEVITQNS